jgi:ABC-2 type transport system permease protein
VHNIWLVARYEIARHIVRKGFIWGIIGLPLILVVVMGGIILFFTSGADDPVGVVDQAGITMPVDTYRDLYEDETPFITFGGEEEARAALLDDEIQAYIVVPADFPANPSVDFVNDGDAFDGIQGNIRDYLQTSMLYGQSPELVPLLGDGSLNVEMNTPSGEGSGPSPITFILPYFIGFIMAIGILASAGYLIQAVVDEKENRTMEILITSITPGQLIAGKISGLVSLGMLQISIWFGMGYVAFRLLSRNLDNFPALDVPFELVAIAILWFVPFYLIVASLMTAVGLSVTEVSEGQQAVGILSLLSMAPLWFFALFINAPNSTLAVFMTLFPLSSFLTVLMRWGFTEIPAWQYLVSWLLTAGTAMLSLYAVSRVLRAGMLRYGQKLSFREITGALRRQEGS